MSITWQAASDGLHSIGFAPTPSNFPRRQRKVFSIWNSGGVFVVTDYRFVSHGRIIGGSASLEGAKASCEALDATSPL